MNSLGRRIEKLQAMKPREGNFAWAVAPRDWTDEQCRQQCGPELREFFSGQDFELSIERAPNVEEFEVIFAGTLPGLENLISEIARRGRKITDRQPRNVNLKKGSNHA